MENKPRLSHQQLTMMVFGFVLGSSLVFSPTGIGPSILPAMLLGLLEGVAIVGIFIWLALRHPGKTYVEITECVFGRYLGPVFSLLYIWFLVQLGGLVLRNFGDFFHIAFMQSTPLNFFLISLALICAYASYGGIEVIARASVILIIITLTAFTMTSLLSVPITDFQNLFPMFDVSIAELLQSAHALAMFPFAETVAFLMIFPAVKNKSRLLPSTIKGLALGAVILVLATARNIAVLGIAFDNMVFPSLAASRLIDVADVFSRLEIIIAINFLSVGFIKISILLYGATKGLSQVLKLQNHQPLALPVGLIMAILGATSFRHGFAENVAFAADTWPLYAPLFIIVIPLITLVVSLLRHRKGVSA